MTFLEKEREILEDEQTVENQSIWSKTTEIPRREFLHGESRVEAAVIGGGLAGLLTAYFLQKSGKKVVVLEADQIGSGQTKNTTAKITSQHGLIYHKLLKKFGEKKAGLYAKAHQEAIEMYQDILKREGFDCHFKRLPSFLYSKTEESKLKREAEAAKKLGIPASFVKESKLPFLVEGAVVFENQAQFHPLEFVKQLSEKLTVYEQTRVLRVKGHYLETSHGNLYADKIIFATHYPFVNMPGFYFLRQHQERSYVLALSGVKPWEGMHYSEDRDGLSFRWFEDLLLVGGGGHRTGTRPAEYGCCILEKQVEKLFPEARIVARWSAQDCMTHDDLPFIGTYSVFRPYWYVATGFKKWGMTGAMVAAKLLSDLVCKEKNPYRELFSPKRFPFHASCKKVWKDITVSAVGLAKGHFHWPLGTSGAPERGQACVLRIGLKRYGVYRDLAGGLHRVSVKCPHLGCELVWNPEGLTWDCPCHGSRFDYDGNLLDNPAQKGNE